MTPTTEQLKELDDRMRKLKAYFPFRIVWGTITPLGVVEVYASYTRHKLNRCVRAGQYCAEIK